MISLYVVRFTAVADGAINELIHSAGVLLDGEEETTEKERTGTAGRPEKTRRYYKKACAEKNDRGNPEDCPREDKGDDDDGIRPQDRLRSH